MRNAVLPANRPDQWRGQSFGTPHGGTTLDDMRGYLRGEVERRRKLIVDDEASDSPFEDEGLALSALCSDGA